MYNKTSYLLIMLLIGATIVIAIPSQSERRPTRQAEAPFDVDEIISEVPGIVSVTYNLAPKPPSTIEAI